MQQKQLYFVIGALAVVIIGLGVYVYREQTKPQGVEIQVNENGIKVQGN